MRKRSVGIQDDIYVGNASRSHAPRTARACARCGDPARGHLLLTRECKLTHRESDTVLRMLQARPGFECRLQRIPSRQVPMA